MKKGYIFTLIIAFAIALATITACSQKPASDSYIDSTSVSATVDTTTIVVDTTAVDSTLLN